jgi:ATP-dependent helicase HrpA
MLIEAAGVRVPRRCLRDRRRPFDHRSARAAEWVGGEGRHLHARFHAPGSDLLGWLLLWKYVNEKRRELSSSQFRRLCRDEFLNHRRIREWQDIHSQLRRVCSEAGLRGSGRNADPDVVHRALLAGLLSHVGRKDPDGYEYRGSRGARFAIAPGSVLFKQSPEWVMATDLVETSRLWARGVARIDPHGWSLSGLTSSPGLFGSLVGRGPGGGDGVRDREPVRHSDRDGQAGAVRSDRPCGGSFALHPARARRRRLGAPNTHFVAHNRQSARRGRRPRSPLPVRPAGRRRHAVRVLRPAVPDDVVSVRHFDAWWRRGRRPRPAPPRPLPRGRRRPARRIVSTLPSFPDEWHHGDVVAPIHYTYDPAAISTASSSTSPRQVWIVSTLRCSNGTSPGTARSW